MAGTTVQQAGVEPIDYSAIVASWSPEERKEREKKFLRKIDARLIPILVCIGTTVGGTVKLTGDSLSCTS